MSALRFPVAFAVDGFLHMANGLQQNALGVRTHFCLTFFHGTAMGRTSPVPAEDHAFIGPTHIPHILPGFQFGRIQGGYGIKSHRFGFFL
jgi:hypothetical protein